MLLNEPDPKQVEDLDGFVQYFDAMSSKRVKEQVLNAKNIKDLIKFHNNLGMDIRNIMGLWTKDSKLSEHLRDLGFCHPDDMSTVLLEYYWSKKHDKPYDVQAQVQKYKEYWDKNGMQ